MTTTTIKVNSQQVEVINVESADLNDIVIYGTEPTGATLTGYQVAYHKVDSVGGVLMGGTFYQTVPLNYHRARNLADDVLGRRSSEEWVLGRAMIIQATNLQELPGFDKVNQDYVDSFTGCVLIEVVRVVPSYGVHLKVEQIAEQTQVG